MRSPIMRLVPRQVGGVRKSVALSLRLETNLQWSKLSRGRDLLFSKFLLLVEGITEYFYFTSLQAKGVPELLWMQEVHVVLLDGKGHLKHALRYAKSACIPWVALVDYDAIDGISRKDLTGEDLASAKKNCWKQMQEKGASACKLFKILQDVYPSALELTKEELEQLLKEPEYTSEGLRKIFMKHHCFVWPDVKGGAMENALGMPSRRGEGELLQIAEIVNADKQPELVCEFLGFLEEEFSQYERGDALDPLWDAKLLPSAKGQGRSSSTGKDDLTKKSRQEKRKRKDYEENKNENREKEKEKEAHVEQKEEKEKEKEKNDDEEKSETMQKEKRKKNDH